MLPPTAQFKKFVSDGPIANPAENLWIPNNADGFITPDRLSVKSTEIGWLSVTASKDEKMKYTNL
jgi:hypothetical protein